MIREAVPYDASAPLSKPTPKTAIYKRAGPGSMMLSYVPWAWVAQQMNEVFGAGWSLRYLADPKMQDGEVLVMVEVITPSGSQQAYGSHRHQVNNPNASYGDAIQSATSKALRRACARWGVGLDLYLKEEEDPAALEVRGVVIAGKNMEQVSVLDKRAQALINSGMSGFEAWASLAEEISA